jgi:hypothetical protein
MRITKASKNNRLRILSYTELMLIHKLRAILSSQSIAKQMEHTEAYTRQLIDLKIPQFTSRDHVLMAQHEWVTILSRHTKID